jgi:branched-chain amino acid transport system substrate-binding protein
MLNSEAITKVQSIILIAIIAVAAVGGSAVYILRDQTSDTIKIGFLTDLDGLTGNDVMQAALLAAEQLNAEGGILGKQVEVIGEDSDAESGLDSSIINAALVRLLTVDNVDFVIGTGDGSVGLMIQDVMAEHKKIFLSYVTSTEEMIQRVNDDYEKYKYFFKYYPANATQLNVALADELIQARELTGFNKVGYLAADHAFYKDTRDELDVFLPENGFDLVYKGVFPTFETFDFSSYFAAAEAAGVEILLPMVPFDNGFAFVKEYSDRQSPMLIFGGILSAAMDMDSWEQTDGKCKYMTVLMPPVTPGIPFTSKTLEFREAYIDRWNEIPVHAPTAAYDIVRFILPDAIERAGTIETDAVIDALEETDIETVLAKRFAFTPSHDVLYGEGMLTDPDDFGHPVVLMQWQENGELVPIYPKWLREETESSYIYPDWPGPWDDLD